jgi:hypothetical protein
MDSFSGSEFIAQKGFGFLCAMRKTAKGLSQYFKELLSIKLDKGECCYSSFLAKDILAEEEQKGNNNMLCIKWVDKKELFFITNCVKVNYTVKQKHRGVPFIDVALHFYCFEDYHEWVLKTKTKEKYNSQKSNQT